MNLEWKAWKQPKKFDYIKHKLLFVSIFGTKSIESISNKEIQNSD